MNGLAIRKSLWLALALSGLGLCLFADCTPLKNTYILAPALAEITALVGDPGTQCMVFVCAGTYFLGFAVLRRHLASAGRMGTRWSASLPVGVLLVGLMALAAVAYAFDYTQAVKSTQALTLIGGVVLGQGAALWEGRRKKEEEGRKGDGESREQRAESRNGEGGSPRTNVQSPRPTDSGMRNAEWGIADCRTKKGEDRRAGDEVVLALIVLLAGAAAWQAETGHVFHYLGQGRWSGPWDNPNTFGILMAVGVVLAGGMAVLGKAESRKQKGRADIQHRAGGCW